MELPYKQMILFVLIACYPAKCFTTSQEVVDLTLDLIKSQDEVDDEQAEAEPSTSTSAAAPVAPAASTSVAAPSHSWQTGDKCVAVWSEDGK